MDTIEVTGTNGDRLVYDGASVAKFRHNGLQESVRNPISTYREIRVTHRPGKRGRPDSYEVLLAMAAFISITVDQSQKARLDALVAALERSSA
ncbi:hypothetical protein [Agromyces binzhouensis]|uniref:Uncharacterized protein n=1 Tax=Agromyces binzhouensis TaxID=1817495 RepID=A0A4Q2JT22_9MICO|nr:hypothetical protein [Agromyces binzhouensis]RXZ49859.1 hypothetical protein ESO86_04940 [Agromyces binzhouensis]